MGLTTGANSQKLADKVEQPVHENPIKDEVALQPVVEEHVVHSVEMVENKRPWFDDLTQDMYHDSATEIEGSRVYADEYFSMLVADDSISSGSSELISAVHREYLSIRNYPIYLDGGIDTNTDAITQKTTTESSGTIGGVLPPQTGDYFVLNTGINRWSVLRIKSAKPLSIYQDRTYAITYVMEEAEKGRLYDDLTQKTTRRLNYIRENHQLGTKYLLTDDEVRTALEDKALAANVFQNYVAEFYSEEFKVFGVEADKGFHTDMIIQGFLNLIERCPDDMYWYPEYQETAKLDTIFDVLVYMSKSKLMNVMDKVYYYHLFSPTDIGHIHPVLISPIGSMPFQKSSRLMNVREPNISVSVLHQSGGAQLEEIGIRDVFAGVQTTPSREFPNVLANDTYLLSETFYAGGASCTLEELLRDALDGRPLDRNRVIDLVAKSRMLEKEERFFITPFLLLLLKVER